MQKALTELETSGLIETERTTGKYVTDNKEQISLLREDYLRERLEPFMKELSSMGLEEEELVSLIRKHYKEAKE